jgi:hypothetical protein
MVESGILASVLLMFGFAAVPASRPSGWTTALIVDRSLPVMGQFAAGGGISGIFFL